MKNKQQTWAKTMLVAYKYLNTLCDAIDSLVDTTAKNSFFCGGNFENENTIYNISQKILKLTDRKIDYINLKVIVETVLKQMPYKYAKILILKYIKQVKNNDIMYALNMSTRSYFRLQEKAINFFANTMNGLGFYGTKMVQTYLNDTFIMSVYENLVSFTNFAIDEEEIVFGQEAFNRYMKRFRREGLTKVVI